LAPWYERHPDDRPHLVNMYGITETTVHVTWRPLSRADVARGSVVGRAIPDLSLRVLDADLRPQPVGVPGEIHVGDAGLAAGYLGRPELTAERFVPDPFGPSGAPGGRLYRSGDLARYLPDGDLEYLGRIDHQVKIRGFRIELGEIEAALAGQPGVREAVVLAREDAPGDRRLVAYLVGEAPAVELRERLAALLPDYMIPSAFVTLPALPLTGNGKVDRRALPAPEAGRDLDDPYAAPETPEEERLAGIWAEVLGVERVGVHDDFFRLGGHSLLAVQILARVRRELQVDLPLRSLFQAPTVAGLSRMARMAREAGNAKKEPRISAVSRAAHRRVRPTEGSPA
ncbi:MAG: phosphopantetheine-binding protein, partial [Thermoanaerobaculia bacterium]